MSYSSAILDALRTAAQKRAAEYTLELVDRLPALSALDWERPAWVGTFSVTQAPQRWLLRQEAVIPWGIWQSPTEVTRDWLSAHWPKGIRRKREQIEACGGVTSPPLLARPGRYPDMAYVDIRATYWSLVYGMGWDVDYWPGRWLARGRPADDFPLPKCKPARNYLVSIALGAFAPPMWIRGRPKYAGSNRHQNLPLWRWVMDVLHSVAADVIAVADPVYINTDGYIVRWEDVDLTIDTIAQWGLKASVRAAGDAQVWGVGSYRVGDRRTKRAYYSRYYEAINEVPYKHWLRRRTGLLLRPLLDT